MLCHIHQLHPVTCVTVTRMCMHTQAHMSCAKRVGGNRLMQTRFSHTATACCVQGTLHVTSLCGWPVLRCRAPCWFMHWLLPVRTYEACAIPVLGDCVGHTHSVASW